MLVILGGLLAGGAGAFTGLLIAYNTSGGPTYTPEIFGQSLATLDSLDRADDACARGRTVAVAGRTFDDAGDIDRCQSEHDPTLSPVCSGLFRADGPP